MTDAIDRHIDDYWNARAESTPGHGQHLEAELVSSIEHLHLLYAVSPLDSTRERVRQRMTNTHSSSQENMMTAIPIPVSQPNPNGLRAPTPLARPRSVPNVRARWATLAAALLIILTAIGSYFAFVPPEDRFFSGGDSSRSVVPATQGTPESGWLQYRNGPAHTGVSAGDGPQSTPIELWSLQTQGPVNSEPAVADGMLYIGSSDGFLYAVDATMGVERWSYDAGAAVDSSPAVNEDTVFIVGRDQRLTAVDRETGERRWDVTPVNPDASATIAGDTLFVASGDGQLYALTADSGDMLWSFDLGTNTGRTPAYSDGVVYAGTASGLLVAINAETGEELWRFEGPFGDAGSTVVAGDTVYQAIFHGSENRFFALDAATGQERWRFASETGEIVWIPAATEDAVYLPSNDGYLYALDVAGNQRWRFAMDGPSESAVTLDSELVYVVDQTGYLYAVEQASGLERWRLPVEGGAVKGPTLFDSVLYVGSSFGTVHAFSAPPENTIDAPATADDGTPSPVASPVAESPVEVLWTMSSGADTFALVGGLGLDPDGNVWVGDGRNGRFSIIDPDGNLIETWGTPGNGDGEFNFMDGPDGYGAVAFDSAGNFYVADTANSRIQKFDPDRNFLLSWGSFGQENGEFNYVLDVAVDHDDNVYALSWRQEAVQKFDGSGTFLARWDVSDSINQLAVDESGAVYITNGCQVSRLSDDGSVTDVWSVHVDDGEDCDGSYGLALDREGHAFVGVTSRDFDPGQQTVQIFSLDGQFLGAWHPRKDESAGLMFDIELVVDRDGNIYVSDYHAGTLQKVRLIDQAIDS